MATLTRRCWACYGEGRDVQTGEPCFFCRGTGARAYLTELMSVRGGVRTYRVPSESDHRLTYTVQWCESTREAVCNCPAGQRLHGQCKHRREVLEITMPETVRTTSGALMVRPMEGALTLSPPATPFPSDSELAVMDKIANAVGRGMGSGLVPSHLLKGDPGNIKGNLISIFLAGRELGVAPMTALRHIYNVNGKAELSGQLMASIVMSRVPGAWFEPVERTAEKAVVRMHIPDRDPIELTYTWEDAKKAGNTGKDTYQHYAADMLWWQAVKRVIRVGAPNLINAVRGQLADAAGVGPALQMAELAPEPEPERAAIAAEPEAEDGIPPEAFNPGDNPEEPVIEATFAEVQAQEPESPALEAAREAMESRDVDESLARYIAAKFVTQGKPVDALADLSDVQLRRLAEGIRSATEPELSRYRKQYEKAAETLPLADADAQEEAA